MFEHFSVVYTQNIYKSIYRNTSILIFLSCTFYQTLDMANTNTANSTNNANIDEVLAQTVNTNIYFDVNFTTITLESNHPLYLHLSDHPGQVLLTIALNDDKFNE